MNSPEVKALIRKNSHLFWYIPDDKKEEIDHEVLVEFILNYGDMDAVKELLRVLGIDKTAEAFYKATGRRKLNYYTEIYHFFDLYFQRHVQTDIKSATN